MDTVGIIEIKRKSQFDRQFLWKEITRMDIDQELQAQSKVLLQKLKARQGKLQKTLKNQNNYSKSSEDDSRELETSTSALKQSLIQSAKARERLAKYKVGSRENNQESTNGQTKYDKNMDQTYNKTEMNNKSILYRKSLVSGTTDNNYTSETNGGLDEHDESDDTPLKAFVQAADNYEPKSATGKNRETYSKPETPNVVRRRKIIDQNVKVDSNLNESELYRDDPTRLNFSYSKFNDSDLAYLQSKLQASPEEVLGTGNENFDGAISDEDCAVKLRYKSRLVDAGNDRKVAAIAREAEKPKSILTNGPGQLKKNLSKVSFLSSKDGSISRESFGQLHDRHLLGYDWISGLLDNDREAMDHSEGYFEELREFRRINRQECCNDFYNQSPESLFELKQREPSPIDEALAETKVKPYQVNDRLFTEPIKDHLFPGHEDVEGDLPHHSKKKPTYEQPRFVRVSIPRSTLMSPHRVKPQKRSQYEPSDSFALSKHCVMGYESSIPSMVPAASNVGLRDATTGVKSKLQTTLADAERMATSYPFPYTSHMSSVRKPTKRKHRIVQILYGHDPT
ncbi:unnamed protein product [Mytilus coruscus]|uniref:Uncharacterized protein n=1 Tax=Mytilus coruscus TaxID=42192 RepID=A0A6J8DIL2_MYTCO|nr:unnamed protein product [Mytilus coruscus]